MSKSIWYSRRPIRRALDVSEITKSYQPASLLPLKRKKMTYSKLTGLVAVTINLKARESCQVIQVTFSAKQSAKIRINNLQIKSIKFLQSISEENLWMVIFQPMELFNKNLLSWSMDRDIELI